MVQRQRRRRQQQCKKMKNKSRNNSTNCVTDYGKLVTLRWWLWCCCWYCHYAVRHSDHGLVWLSGRCPIHYNRILLPLVIWPVRQETFFKWICVLNHIDSTHKTTVSTSTSTHKWKDINCGFDGEKQNRKCTQFRFGFRNKIVCNIMQTQSKAKRFDIVFFSI